MSKNVTIFVSKQVNIKKFTQKSKNKVTFWLLNGLYYHFRSGTDSLTFRIHLDLINQNYRLALPIMARKNTLYGIKFANCNIQPIIQMVATNNFVIVEN